MLISYFSSYMPNTPHNLLAMERSGIASPRWCCCYVFSLSNCFNIFISSQGRFLWSIRWQFEQTKAMSSISVFASPFSSLIGSAYWGRFFIIDTAGNTKIGCKVKDKDWPLSYSKVYLPFYRWHQSLGCPVSRADPLSSSYRRESHVDFLRSFPDLLPRPLRRSGPL